jgi:hypothetical protein
MKAAERISDYLHPALSALRAKPSREGEFWNDIARLRTPLIETDPASSQHSIVTFVWRLPRTPATSCCNPASATPRTT